jgi:lipopolysaccharide/colanic/teichoic acid biosynthesis glycosyltransferase
MNYSTLKRFMDIFISAIALFLLSPILLLVALAIVLESKGSPLFFQNRVGRNCKIFRIIKFRSMVSGADKLGTAWTQTGDSRITKVGKFIRSTSLDELPQLWNVLMGVMSIFGPRPILANDEHLYTPEQWRLRHSVLSGITGLAQVKGRSSLNIEQQTEYDSEYAKNYSLGMDISIIIKTLLIVLQRKGVN